MKLIRIISLTFIMSFCVLSCSKTADNGSLQEARNETEMPVTDIRNYTREEIDEANSLYLPVEELGSFTEEMKARRRANIILMEYLVPRDSFYAIDISEDEAAKLGVAPEYYRAALKDIERADSARKESIKQGIPVEETLPDFREEFRAMKDSIFNKYPD